MAGPAEAGGTEGRAHKGCEMPPYTVAWQDGAREIRGFGPHLLAEVRVSGRRSGAIRAGFRTLDGYIFGGNATGEKIAMTVPVAQTPVAGGEIWIVSSMMPARSAADTLPAPRGATIRLVMAGPSRQLVERFPGIPGTESLAGRAEVLRARAGAQGHGFTARPHRCFCDAPMTLLFLRRADDPAAETAERGGLHLPVAVHFCRAGPRNRPFRCSRTNASWPAQ